MKHAICLIALVLAAASTACMQALTAGRGRATIPYLQSTDIEHHLMDPHCPGKVVEVAGSGKVTVRQAENTHLYRYRVLLDTNPPHTLSAWATARTFAGDVAVWFAPCEPRGEDICDPLPIVERPHPLISGRPLPRAAICPAPPKEARR